MPSSMPDTASKPDAPLDMEKLVEQVTKDVQSRILRDAHGSFTEHAARFVRQHGVNLLVAVPLIGGLTAALQVFIASDGDRSTFAHMVRTLDVQAIILFTLTPLTAVLMVAAVVAFFTYHLERPHRADFSAWRSSARAVFFGSILAVIFAGPMVLILMSSTAPNVMLGIAAGIGWGASLRKTKNDPLGPTLRRSFLTGGVAPGIAILLGMNALSGGIWLPAESAVVGNDAKPSRIYVLEAKEDQATLLDGTSKTVRVVPLDTLKNRKTCTDRRRWYEMPMSHFLVRSQSQRYHHERCPS